jgi:hypothetical protein
MCIIIVENKIPGPGAHELEGLRGTSIALRHLK